MKMNNFDYLTASDEEFMEFLVSEITDIMKEPECVEFTRFEQFERIIDPSEFSDDICGTYRCALGWIGYRLGLKVTNNYLEAGSKNGDPFDELVKRSRDLFERIEPGKGAFWWDRIFGGYRHIRYSTRLESIRKLQTILMTKTETEI